LGMVIGAPLSDLKKKKLKLPSQNESM